MMKSLKSFSTILSAGVGLLALQGALTPAVAQQECFIGEVKYWGGNFAPQNWAFTDGQLLAVSQFDALFSILGTTYGGDGRTTFALPDLRGRVPIGTGAGPGLTEVRLGQVGGQQMTTMTAANMPSHTHTAATSTTINATTLSGDSVDPAGRILSDDNTDNIYNSGPKDTAMINGAAASTTTLSASGGNQSFGNEQPSLATNYIICLYGIYPSRN